MKLQDLTAPQRLRYEILKEALKSVSYHMDVPVEEFAKEGYDPIEAYRDKNEADSDWRDLEECIQQVESEFRYSGDADTDLDCESSRHYESRSVASKFGNDDGTATWIGWTYWYGGGKHGEPGVIEWIDDAYYLDVEEVVTTVLKFKKKQDVEA